MLRNVFIAILVLLSTGFAKARTNHLLPQPQQIAVKEGGRVFAMERKIVLSDPTDCWLLRSVLEENGCELVAKSKFRVEVRLVDEIAGSYDYRLDGYENEAYRLDVDENRISIEAVHQRVSSVRHKPCSNSPRAIRVVPALRP